MKHIIVYVTRTQQSMAYVAIDDGAEIQRGPMSAALRDLVEKQVKNDWETESIVVDYVELATHQSDMASCEYLDTKTVKP